MAKESQKDISLQPSIKGQKIALSDIAEVRKPWRNFMTASVAENNWTMKNSAHNIVCFFCDVSKKTQVLHNSSSLECDWLWQCCGSVHKRLHRRICGRRWTPGGSAVENCFSSSLDTVIAPIGAEILPAQHRLTGPRQLQSSHAWWNHEVPAGCHHTQYVKATIWRRHR